LDLYLFYYEFYKIMNTQVLLYISCLLACTVHLSGRKRGGVEKLGKKLVYDADGRSRSTPLLLLLHPSPMRGEAAVMRPSPSGS